jgi:hypothetical protein
MTQKLFLGVFICFLAIGCNKPDQPTPSILPATTIKKWSNADGKALAVVISGTRTKDEYITFVKQAVAEKKLANLQIYSSKEAFEAVQAANQNDSFRKGFILIFRRVNDKKGEIWWMQEEGNVANLVNTVTPINL